jgi:hypothetical protein
VKAQSRRNLYGRIGIFLVGLGFASIGLGSLLKGESSSEGFGSAFGSAPIFVLVGLLAMGAALFMKNDTADRRPVGAGKKSRRR